MLQMIKKLATQWLLLAANILFLFLTPQISFWPELILTILLSALTVVATVLLCLKKEMLYRLNVSIQTIAVILLVVIFLLDKLSFFEKVSNRDTLMEFVKSFGHWSVLVFFLIQFLQVLVAPIPATVTIAAGSLAFGFWLGSLISLLAIVAGSLVAFLLGRKFGYKMVAWIVGEDNLKKGLKLIKGKDKAVITLMFLFPFFPDDLLCFVAGLTTMSFRYFAIMVTVSRIITVSTTGAITELFSSFIASNPLWGTICAAIAIIVMLIIFYFGVKNAERIENWFTKLFSKKKKAKSKEKKDEA